MQQATAQAQQYFLEKRICKKNRAGTAIFPRNTDLQKTAQAQQYFLKKRIHNKNIAQAQENF